MGTDETTHAIECDMGEDCMCSPGLPAFPADGMCSVDGCEGEVQWSQLYRHYRSLSFDVGGEVKVVGTSETEDDGDESSTEWVCSHCGVKFQEPEDWDYSVSGE